MEHNISVIGPDEPGVAIDYGNALQLHPGGFSTHVYSHDSFSTTMSQPSFSRPQLAHLQTSPTQYHQMQSNVRADQANLSVTSSGNDTLTAPPMDWPLGRGNEGSPVMTSPTYPYLSANSATSASPLSQGLSPLTPITPLTTASSPAVVSHRFLGLPDNHGSDFYTLQGDICAPSPAPRGRPMQHFSSQPNLRTQEAMAYNPSHAQTQSATNYYYRSSSQTSPFQPSSSVSSWTSPTEPYSALDGTEVTRIPPSPLINQYEGHELVAGQYSPNMDSGYTPSSYSSLAGAVPMPGMSRVSNTSVDVSLQYNSVQSVQAQQPRSMQSFQVPEILDHVSSASDYPIYPVTRQTNHGRISSESNYPEHQAHQLRDDRHAGRTSQHPEGVHRPQPITSNIFNGLPIPGPLVPQVRYRPATASDHRRYVLETPLMEPIHFTMSNGLGRRAGVLLDDALHMRMAELDGKDDVLDQDWGPSISLRLLWKGYTAWTKQIPTRDYKQPPQPITRAKLARAIARALAPFFEEMTRYQMGLKEDQRWRIGEPHGITHRDLILLSLHHVSKGSWQINLCLNRPL